MREWTHEEEVEPQRRPAAGSAEGEGSGHLRSQVFRPAHSAGHARPRRGRDHVVELLLLQLAAAEEDQVNEPEEEDEPADVDDEGQRLAARG